MPNTHLYTGVNYRENSWGLNPHAELFITPSSCDQPRGNLGNSENLDGISILSTPLNTRDFYTPLFRQLIIIKTQITLIQRFLM